MNIKDTDELSRLLRGLTEPEEQAPEKPQPAPVPVVVEHKNDELIAAVQSLETAVRGDEKKDGQLLLAVQSLEQAIRAPRKWVFTVERNFEGITKIVAESK